MDEQAILFKNRVTMELFESKSYAKLDGLNGRIRIAFTEN